MQQKIKLFGDKDEIINRIRSECSKLAQKEYKTRNDWVGRGDLLGTVQEIKFWWNWEMVYAQPRLTPGKSDAQTPIPFWNRTLSPNLGQKTRPYNN